MSTAFSRWLSRELINRDMSQSELAQKVGASPAAVNHWVRGRRVPDPPLCYAIADAFNLSPTAVMVRAGHPVDEPSDADAEEEERVIAMWRRLSGEGRRDVMRFLEWRRDEERVQR